MSNLPFELSKRHKKDMMYKWVSRGMIFQDEQHFNYIYNIYIRETHCDLCNKLFPNSKDRQLDHCHQTGDIRNILCQYCNIIKKDNKQRQTNTGEPNIIKCKHKSYKSGYCFRIRIERHGTLILYKKANTLEKAINIRDIFLKENPDIFT